MITVSISLGHYCKGTLGVLPRAENVLEKYVFLHFCNFRGFRVRGVYNAVQSRGVVSKPPDFSSSAQSGGCRDLKSPALGSFEPSEVKE